MGLLDRFRSEPRWKHADPMVRAAAVQEMEDHDQDALVALATDDVDARVRRAAIRRVADASALGKIARREVDDQARSEAVQRLIDIACGASPAEAPASPDARGRAEAALAAIDDARHLAIVAKTATTEDVCRAALRRVSDAKTLGSIARHADRSSIRIEALARVEDSTELAAVATKTEHKDIALAALERLDDPALIQSIATRARVKLVARRAKSILRDRQAAPAAEPEPVSRPVFAAPAVEAPAVKPPTGSLASAVTRSVESLLHVPDPTGIEADLSRLTEEWSALTGDLSPDDADAARFTEAVARVRERLANGEEERRARHRTAEEVAGPRGERIALCERVESAEPHMAAETAEAARRDWDALPQVDHPDIAAAAARFDGAMADAARRHTQWMAGEERSRRLCELAGEAEGLLAGTGTGSRDAWSALRREWSRLEPAGPVDPPIAERFERAVAEAASREQAARDAREHQEREHLRSLERLADEMERLIGGDALTLKRGTQALQQIRSLVEHPRQIAARRESDAAVERLKAVQTALFAKVQELKDADDWQRWANATVQEELCVKAEALRERTEVPAAMAELRALQEQWKKVSVAPREKAQELWNRFKAAGDHVRGRADAHQAQVAEARAGNLVLKEALCARAEALSESTDWLKTADELKRLQAEWKTVGPSLREKAVWERFRKACDLFFTRRHADLQQRKETWSANLEKKEALCAEVEALADTTDWNTAAPRVRQIQTEWRAVGPVRRNKSDEIWARFVAASERFFERYRQRDLIALQTRLADREAVCQEIEAASTHVADAGDGHALAQRVHAWRRTWDQSPPVPKENLEPLAQRFNTAIQQVLQVNTAALRGTELDVEANRRKLEALCSRVEKHATEGTGPAAPSSGAALATQLREALAANTIGGRVNDEAKWKAAADDVRDAQGAYRRLGPLPAADGPELNDRFQRACGRFFDLLREKTGQPDAGRPASAPPRRA